MILTKRLENDNNYSMQKLVTPIKKINGDFYFSGDKSISHRVVLFPLVFPKLFKITNLSNCEDVKTSLAISKTLGTSFEHKPDNCIIADGTRINHNFENDKIELYCGNSGTTARLLCCILANFHGKFILTGDKSLSKRPMKRIVIPLRQMGINISCDKSGTLPIEIDSNGKSKSIFYENITCSAQVKSAIQLASLASGNQSTIKEPYESRDHTERLINLIKNQEKTVNINIPGDPSSAAYFAAIAAMFPNNTIILKDILLNKTRIEFFNVISQMGAEVEFNIKNNDWEPIGDIKITGQKLKSITIQPSLIPSLIDELPLLAIIMTQAEGISRVFGAQELRKKESDRISCLIRELKKLNIQCDEYEDGFAIYGKKNITDKVIINPENDHRLAMSFSILALKSLSGLIIDNAESVNISFPNFFEKIFIN